ncbi:protease modulator HflC [bacterium]|nr:protease modulator HflC [bacterium]
MAAVRKSTLLATVFFGIVGLFVLITLGSAMYSVDEKEQVIILQFGAPVGEPIDDPGLHFKKPFIQEVRRFDKRLLTWDGFPNEIPTKGREFIFVDTTARWKIVKPQLFLESVRDEQGAQSRLDDIIDSVVRDEISSLELVEIVRSTTWDVARADLERDQVVVSSETDEETLTREIRIGREGLTERILEKASAQTPTIGIELVDFRIKRLNYVEQVRKKVYDRMISERERIATQFRSEGEGRSAEIRGETEKKLREIQSVAQRKAEEIKGKADAEATRIYGQAFSSDPEFYAFLRTLESYPTTIGSGTTLVLGTDTSYFQYLKELGSIGDLENAPPIPDLKDIIGDDKSEEADLPELLDGEVDLLGNDAASNETETSAPASGS